MSFRILLFAAIYLTVQQLVLSDPIPRNQVTFDEDECKNVTEEAKKNYNACVSSHFLQENETRIMYTEHRCPHCAHVCSQAESVLKCSYDIIDTLHSSYSCGENVQVAGKEFFRGILEATTSFVCEDGGDKLSTIIDDENIRCIVSKQGRCRIDFNHHDGDGENKIERGENSSESRDSLQESACRAIIGWLSCVSKKAELCNEETANVLNSFADYLKKSSPCSKFFSEN
ncbi:uncharacterized protein [Hetaerina americana]|uniref:uncharacterized protein n=1 Tax=Hetaerina americana TaxID=62018 RepID=UPI003A7F2062